jgi:hypothetical protein
MELWEQLTKAALLGTQKYNPDEVSLTAPIQTALGTHQQGDPEDKLLRKAVITMVYRQAGKEFPVVTSTKYNASEPEVLPLCSREAIEILRRILYEKQDQLLEVFLQEMVRRQLRISPELIPALLDKAKEHKEIRQDVRVVIGKRGEWLSALNPEWQHFSTVSLQEAWQTGNLEIRKEVLLQLRKTNPAVARDWLLETWKSEKSTTKTAFLNLFSVHLSMADEPMLEQMLQEKARIVKEVAEKLLFRLKESRVLNRIWLEAHQCIKLVKKGNIFRGNQANIQVEIPSTLPVILEQNGIIPTKDKFLSHCQHIFTAHSTLRTFHHLVLAGLTEAESWLYQICLILPPEKWKQQFVLSDEELIQLLLNDEFSYLISALVNAAILHQDYGFIQAILPQYLQRNRFLSVHRDKSGYYLRFNLIDALPISEKQAYEHELIHLLEQDDFQFYSYLEVYNYQWSHSMARAILKKIAEKCSSGKYYYHFYDPRQIQKLSQYLPPTICQEWEALQPPDEMGKARWQQATSLLFNTLDLKQRISLIFPETETTSAVFE